MIYRQCTLSCGLLEHCEGIFMRIAPFVVSCSLHMVTELIQYCVFCMYRLGGRMSRKCIYLFMLVSYCRPLFTIFSMVLGVSVTALLALLSKSKTRALQL